MQLTGAAHTPINNINIKDIAYNNPGNQIHQVNNKIIKIVVSLIYYNYLLKIFWL